MLGMSIRNLAEQCGLSIGMISQIESGKSDPSLRSLRLLGEALNTSLGDLFNDDEQPRPTHPNIVRRDERSLLKDNPLIRKEFLSPSGHRDFEIYRMVLQPGSNSGSANYTHSGEKAAIILSGSLRIWLNDQLLDVQAGDTVQFSSATPHRYANQGETTTEILWILSSTPG